MPAIHNVESLLTCSHFVLMLDASQFRTLLAMNEAAQTDSASEADPLDAAIDQAIAACGGDMRDTIRALILTNAFLEHELETKVSKGFLRGVKHGRLNTYSG
jgi:hypothetical protein